jgi:hypothetical protein
MAMARSDDFKSPPCRLAFSQGLFKPRAAAEGAAKKYGCTLIIENKWRPQLEKVIGEIIVEQWGEKGLMRAKAGGIKSPLLAGDGKEARSKNDGELHPGFGPEFFFIRTQANEDHKPIVLWNTKEMQATQEEVYSGCYGFAVINCWAWNHPSSGDGVSFGIRLFQKTRDGESIGGVSPLDVDKWYEQIDPSDSIGDVKKSGGGKSAGSLFG